MTSVVLQCSALNWLWLHWTKLQQRTLQGQGFKLGCCSNCFLLSVLKIISTQTTSTYTKHKEKGLRLLRRNTSPFASQTNLVEYISEKYSSQESVNWHLAFMLALICQGFKCQAPSFVIFPIDDDDQHDNDNDLMMMMIVTLLDKLSCGRMATDSR